MGAEEIEEGRLAELGGYSFPFSAKVCLVLGFLLMLLAFSMASDIRYLYSDMPYLVFVLGGFSIIMGFYIVHEARQECIQKGRELEANESSRRNYAHKKQEIDRASTLLQEGGLANLQEALVIYSKYGYDVKGGKKEIAREKEKLLDYAGAIKGFEELELHEDAARVRRKMLDEKKVDQTVVHGDYVDDRDTIIKDSVISKSSIGAGGDDKFARLEKLTEMKEKGLIDGDEFKQMKKEILGN
jgi:hypothetical protein